jgi:hypothetical protein
MAVPDTVALVAAALLVPDTGQAARTAAETNIAARAELSIVVVVELSIGAAVEAAQKAAPAREFVASQPAAPRSRSPRRSTGTPFSRAEHRVHSGGRPS